jgi:hypothetical protein
MEELIRGVSYVRHPVSNTWKTRQMFIICVPLATEPGISLIILTPMKILQRNLNRSTFFSLTFLTQ